MVQNKMYSSQVFMKDAEMEQKQLHKVVCISQQLETRTGPEYCWMQPLCIKLLVLFLIVILLIFNAGLEYRWSTI